ncbi:MAG: SusC/RagA family TonB-linked outer membrane protein [Cytophagaceae bacterium]|nr:SusC/RagA family TonB-linked outer membrane protein [Gemmatimonadaceae bacterium]
MAVSRCLLAALVGGVLAVQPLQAQGATGSISGRVVDSTSQQPIGSVQIQLEGTQRGTATRQDGGFVLTEVAAGVHRLKISRIGYRPETREVTVSAGAAANVQVSLAAVAANLSAVVVTGYGTQRREAITGAVAAIDATEANVGVVTNATGLLQGRVAGVNLTLNSGEPGAGAQIRIRGGTSISASNDPLYVIDGVPIQNDQTEATGLGIGGGAALARNPLTLLNPSDIASISVLKDASATAIYGSRAANGVVLIETRKGRSGTSTMEYEVYGASANAASKLEFLSGAEYRNYVQQQVTAGALPASRLTDLGTANTNWEDELMRTGYTQNHNLSFSGGAQNTTYRASMNYMNQQGILISNGFKRYQGRLNANHEALAGGKLRLGINLTTSRLDNDYLPYENTGGFEGGVLANMAIFNPTFPVYVTDATTKAVSFYETGAGAQSTRNPVALANQVLDRAQTTRYLGSVTASYNLWRSLTAQLNVGADRSTSNRQTYLPRNNPVGASFGGRARQVERNLSNVNLQSLLTFAPTLPSFIPGSEFEMIGGYEYAQFENGEFGAEGQNFTTDLFTFNNLGGGGTLVPPFSWNEESRLVSFFTRANWGLNNKYFLTGVLRRDGSSRFGAGNKWATFPAVSASWRLSEEGFMKGKFFSDFRVRAGYGLQGNQAVAPYSSLILLEPSNGARYPFGSTVVTGVVPTRNANPLLKWEQTAQTSAAIDYAFANNRFSGTVEYYQKNTEDLLLTVSVPQPALVSTRLENVGKLKNTGFEASFDGNVLNKGQFSLSSGLVLAVERNEVQDLGGRSFITTASVSGQGQSGQNAQRIIPGRPLGTFFGPEFIGVNAAGKQEFNKYTVTRDATGRETSRVLAGKTTAPGGDDYTVIGNANPDFSLGFRSNANFGKFDASWLWRAEMGRDVFNNTSLVYANKANVLTSRNVLKSALGEPDALTEPAIYSSRYIEDGSFVRLQNITVGYTFNLPTSVMRGGSARAFFSGDNLLVSTNYSGYDPEVYVDAGLASRGIDYLTYPRARTFTGGIRLTF